MAGAASQPAAGSAARHLSSQTLAALFCGELSRLDCWRVRRHLAGCAPCRERKASLEGPLADAMLAAFRDATLIAPDLPQELPQAPREAFAQWLAAQPILPSLGQLPSLGRPEAVRQLEELHSSRLRRLAARSSHWPSSLHLSRVAAVATAVLLLGVACLHWWPRRSAPELRPDALLVRAEKREALESAAAAGAVRQTVLIKAGPYALKRPLYWDPTARRRAGRVDWTRDHDPLGAASAAAGLDWNRPLSASAYEAWRKHQRLRAESVTRSAHLLTLTTTVADGGAISAESLTLRESDLHAVARSVDLRGRGTVEIAEVDYTVLPWTAVPPYAFEPVEQPAVPDADHVTPRPVLSLAVPPDADQLDAAELAARLVLSRFHADAGEQIVIRSTPRWVEVSGVIEEDDRCGQLRAALSLVPRLKVSIVSASEVANQIRSATPASITTVEESNASLPDHPSALETYLAARGQDVAARNAVAQQLFAGTLAITHECKALAELDQRFPHPGQMPVVESATLAALRYSHHERLSAALGQEFRLLALLRGQAPEVPAGGATARPSARSLTEQAEDTLALARELTQTNAPVLRNAEVLFKEMAARLDELAAASQWRAAPGAASTADQDQSTEPHPALMPHPAAESNPGTEPPR
jgi:hypothetical protein